jgi:endoglucanase
MKNPSLTEIPSLLAAALALTTAACNNSVPGIAEPDAGVFVPCPDNAVLLAEGCVLKSDLVELPAAFNFIGFRPERVKRATLFEDVAEFRLLNADGDVVFTAAPTGPVKDSTGKDTWIADFTEFRDPGDYQLDFDGVAEDAAPFLTIHIGDKVFDKTLGTVVTSFTGMRCGTAVHQEHNGETFSHPTCHAEDGDLKYATTAGGTHDGTKGWHDAGDYGKYSVNGAFAAGMMLQAWERTGEASLGDDAGLGYQIPETGGKLPDFLDEVKWQLDWMMNMQLADGSAYHKIATLDFPSMIMAEDDLATRYFSSVSTVGTADIVAGLAQCARVYQPFDATYAAKCKTAAEKGWTFLTDHPQPIVSDQSAFGIQNYDSTDGDERLWAAAEVWSSTGAADALTYFETNAATAWSPVLDWDWGYVSTMGVLTYLHSTRTGRDPAIVAELESKVLSAADSMVANAEANPYGIGYDGNPYWGINGIIVRMTMVLNAAYTQTSDAKYLDTAILQLDHVLGRNLYARSFVTGIGHAPPRHPHHRPSSADGITPPWPGLLVGGPGEGPVRGWEGWLDSEASAETNEVAINWNASLVFALSLPYGG